jgi:hypothetical protein
MKKYKEVDIKIAIRCLNLAQFNLAKGEIATTEGFIDSALDVLSKEEEVSQFSLDELLLQAEEWLGLGWDAQKALKIIANNGDDEIEESDLEAIQHFANNLPDELYLELQNKIDSYKTQWTYPDGTPK